MVVRRETELRLWFIEREVESILRMNSNVHPYRASNYGARGVHDRIWLAIEFNRKYEELSKLIRDAYGRIVPFPSLLTLALTSIPLNQPFPRHIDHKLER